MLDGIWNRYTEYETGCSSGHHGNLGWFIVAFAERHRDKVLRLKREGFVIRIDGVSITVEFSISGKVGRGMLNDTVKVRVRCDCTICDGTGWIKDRRECLSCEGLGTHDEGRDGPELLSVLHQVLSAYERRSGVATEMRVRLEEEVACGHCNGTGDSFPAPGTCSFCNGSGMLWQEV